VVFCWCLGGGGGDFLVDCECYVEYGTRVVCFGWDVVLVRCGRRRTIILVAM